MATLKREVKKLPSEQNLRLLSSLIVSLANKQSSLEDKCIAPWKADETYQKDISYVSHNGYVYICSVTNQDSTFTESHWTKLADEFTELDVDTIKSYLNLTQEQITNLQSLIDDTTITTTKTNSSSKIYMDIQAAIAECKDDTLKQIAKKVSGSYKIATSTSDVTSADFIYLINNGVNYDLYVLVDSTPTKVGDTSIDLSDYAKLTDLADYLKKTDAASTYATITTVDGKVDKTSILTANDPSATDDQVYSAKAINTELDKVVKKTDIVDNLTSTDTDKPLSANQGKVLNDTINEIKTNFQDGVNTIYDSVVAKGVTPVDKSPSSISNAIGGIITPFSTLKVTANGIIANKRSTNIEFSASSMYILSCSLKFTETANYNRMDIFFINNGVVEPIYTNDIGYSNCSISGNYITVRNTHGSYYTQYVLTEFV